MVSQTSVVPWNVKRPVCLCRTSQVDEYKRQEYNPVTTNDTEVGKQRNRRTQIIITPKLDQFMDLIDKAPEEK